MHLIAVKSDIARQHPWLPGELSRLVDESQRVWTAKRRKYAETSPWIIEELLEAAHALPPAWNDSGMEVNRRMIEDFAGELHVQGILSRRVSAEELFPFAASLRAASA
jgi:4,5-dihydroxyphthalate decarboxylase